MTIERARGRGGVEAGLVATLATGSQPLMPYSDALAESRRPITCPYQGKGDEHPFIPCSWLSQGAAVASWLSLSSQAVWQLWIELT